MAIEKLKNLPVIGRAFFSDWMKKINEVIEGVNGVGTTVDEELDPEVEGSLANTVAGIEEQLDPETEGTLANTVDGVVDEIGDDETADTILGRITALENSSGGGGEWEAHDLYNDYRLYFGTLPSDTLGAYIVRDGVIVVTGYKNVNISSGNESGSISTPTLIAGIVPSVYSNIICRAYSAVNDKQYEWFVDPTNNKANIYYNFDSGTTGSKRIYFQAIYFFNNQE